MPILGGWFTSRRAAPAPPPVKGTVQGASGQAPNNVGTLVSDDTLRTMGGLTLAVSVVWGGVEKAIGMPHQMWLGALLSLIACGLLFVDDLMDPNRAATPRLPMRVLAAVVNAFIVYGAASTAVTTVLPAAAPPPAGQQTAAPK